MSASSNTDAPAPPPSTERKSPMSSGMIIGMIIAGVIVAALLIVFVIYMIKRSRNATGAALSMPSPPGPNNGMPGPTNSNLNSNRLSGGNGRN